MLFIYLIEGPNKNYIGKTEENLDTRWREHRYSARSGCPYLLHKAIRKYGELSFTIKEIDRTEDIKYGSKVLEPHYIRHFNTLMPNGYNMTEGGDGISGFKFSIESRMRMSESRRGRFVGVNSPLFGTHPSEETVRRMSVSQKGNTNAVGTIWSDEQRERASISKKGVLNPKSIKWKITLPDGTTVITYDRKSFCEDHNLNYNSFRNSGRKGTLYKGYFCEKFNGYKT